MKAVHHDNKNQWVVLRYIILSSNNQNSSEILKHVFITRVFKTMKTEKKQK